MIKRRLALLALEGVLLLTACGQTGNSSASTMLPVAAVQSAAQAIAPAEDKAQEDVDSLPAEEATEEAEPAGGEDTPKLAADVETPSAKAEGTPPAPAETAPPAAPKQPVTPAPEDKPAPAPTPVPTPAEKQEEQPAPAPEPVPAPEPKPEPADRWAAVSAANAYAVTQYS